MRADVNLIRLALEGREEAEHDLYAAIYGAQGIKLPPLKRDEDGPKLASSDEVRNFLLVEGARNEAVRKAKGKATGKNAPEPGKPPPRRSKPRPKAK